MKRFLNVLSAVTVTTALSLCTPCVGHAQIFTANSDNTIINGALGTSDILGYNGEIAKTVKNSIEWSISNNPGVYRMWYYCPLSLNGSTDAGMRIDSEFVKKTVPINFADGNCGWREVSMTQCSTAGMTIELIGGTVGETYATAVWFEKLDDDWLQPWNFIKNSEKHIIISDDSDVAIVNGLRMRLTTKPRREGGALYVSCRDLGKLLSKSVNYSGGTLTFKDDNGNDYVTAPEMLKTFNDIEMINLSELYISQGKSELIYGDSLFILTDTESGLSASTDAKQLKTILTVLRNEKL